MKCDLPAFILWPGRSVAALWLALSLMTICLPASAAEQSYVVKKGDTLWSIAQKHGTSVNELADRNGISRNGFIYAGQRLKVPAKSTSSSGLPSAVQRAIDSAPVKAGRWKYIVIHHSGVDTGTVKGMDEYHREVRHMENGLAYHFVIGNGRGMRDGEVSACPRWTKQLAGGHLASESQNRVAIGICLVGNFDRRAPSARQMKSLELLVEALMKRCHLSSKAVKTHQEINVIHTRCPGAKFPSRTFRNSLGRK